MASEPVRGFSQVEKVQWWWASRVGAQDLHRGASAGREGDEEGLEVRNHAAKESFVVRHSSVLL
jgi:hypothetical protein